MINGWQILMIRVFTICMKHSLYVCASHTQTIMGYYLRSLYLAIFSTLSKNNLCTLSLYLAYSREVPSRGKSLGPGISCSDLTSFLLKVVVVVEKVEHRKQLCLNTLASFMLSFLLSTRNLVEASD